MWQKDRKPHSFKTSSNYTRWYNKINYLSLQPSLFLDLYMIAAMETESVQIFSSFILYRYTEGTGNILLNSSVCTKRWFIGMTAYKTWRHFIKVRNQKNLKTTAVFHKYKRDFKNTQTQEVAKAGDLCKRQWPNMEYWWRKKIELARHRHRFMVLSSSP